MFFIIDGHNLLWAIRNNSEESSVNDIELCRMVSVYLGLTRQKGQLIFDGTGPPERAPFHSIRNLEVFFSGAHSDADTVIENKISASTAPKNLTVVSSDRRLRKAAGARKAVSVKSEIFWMDVQKQLTRKRATPEPKQKRDGLTDGETTQWLKLFGMEQ
ncbi:MAG: NYN domain-containing protein [Planctomycetota bacterium]|jgi:predicted RNA-binding protein with PIN domain